MPAKKQEPTWADQRAEYVELIHFFSEECDKHVLANKKASDMRAASAARAHFRKTQPGKWNRIMELEKAGQGMLR